MSNVISVLIKLERCTIDIIETWTLYHQNNTGAGSVFLSKATRPKRKPEGMNVNEKEVKDNRKKNRGTDRYY